MVTVHVQGLLIRGRLKNDKSLDGNMPRPRQILSQNLCQKRLVKIENTGK
jgi:hypothetical protein